MGVSDVDHASRPKEIGPSGGQDAYKIGVGGEGAQPAARLKLRRPPPVWEASWELSSATGGGDPRHGLIETHGARDLEK